MLSSTMLNTFQKKSIRSSIKEFTKESTGLFSENLNVVHCMAQQAQCPEEGFLS